MIKSIVSVFFFAVYRYLILPIQSILSRLHNSGRDKIDTHWPELPSRPIWIHLSPPQITHQIKATNSMILNIKNKWPQRMILVTHDEPDSRMKIKPISGIDAIVILPLDERHLVHQFLQHFNPKILVLNDSEIWPEFFYQIGNRKIPTVILSSSRNPSQQKPFFSVPLEDFALRQLDILEHSKTQCVVDQIEALSQ